MHSIPFRLKKAENDEEEENEDEESEEDEDEENEENEEEGYTEPDDNDIILCEVGTSIDDDFSDEDANPVLSLSTRVGRTRRYFENTDSKNY